MSKSGNVESNSREISAITNQSNSLATYRGQTYYPIWMSSTCSLQLMVSSLRYLLQLFFSPEYCFGFGFFLSIWFSLRFAFGPVSGCFPFCYHWLSQRVACFRIAWFCRWQRWPRDGWMAEMGHMFCLNGVRLYFTVTGGNSVCVLLPDIRLRF